MSKKCFLGINFLFFENMSEIWNLFRDFILGPTFKIAEIMALDQIQLFQSRKSISPTRQISPLNTWSIFQSCIPDQILTERLLLVEKSPCHSVLGCSEQDPGQVVDLHSGHYQQINYFLFLNLIILMFRLRLMRWLLWRFEFFDWEWNNWSTFSMDCVALFINSRVRNMKKMVHSFWSSFQVNVIMSLNGE